MLDLEKEKIELNNLCAKIGVFFANCDEEFAPEERAFLERYLVLSDNRFTPNDGKQLTIDEVSKDLTIDEVIKDTKVFLDDFKGTERLAMLGMLFILIDRVIAADGVYHPKEIELFEQWKKAVL